MEPKNSLEALEIVLNLLPPARTEQEILDQIFWPHGSSIVQSLEELNLLRSWTGHASYHLVLKASAESLKAVKRTYVMQKGVSFKLTPSLLFVFLGEPLFRAGRRRIGEYPPRGSRKSGYLLGFQGRRCRFWKVPGSPRPCI